MSSVEYLRGFISERLTAAAEEIFGVLEKTIVEYEEEIDRQRRLLDIAWKPEIKLHRIVPPELPQQDVCKEEEVVAEQQLCVEERSSSVEQEEPEPPEIKEEEEEVCSSQEGEQLEVKQETDDFMLAPTDAEVNKGAAAAEETFGVLEKTKVEYEEEIDRRCRLFDIAWKPEIKLHRIELPQQHVWKEEKVAAAQQLCVQERSSSVEQEEPEPPQIKEEEEEEQLEVKQETDDFMLTPTDEESEHSEDQTVNWSITETQNMVEETPLQYIPDKSYVVPEEDSDHQLLSHEAESQDQKGDKHGDSGSTIKAEQTEPNHNSNSHINNSYNPTVSTIHHKTHTGKKSLKCDTCGKAFTFRSIFQRHMRAHTGEKPYSCNICGKNFTLTSGLNAHIRTHTGEKPFICKMCGKEFAFSSPLKVHMRTHTGEKPYSCNICEKKFSQISILNDHRRTHTGEKPFCCKTCGKDFTTRSNLKVHTRTHTGERPYSCKTCGKDFIRNFDLKVHMRIHTGEKPHSCSTRRKRSCRTTELKSHVRTHTGDRRHIDATPVEKNQTQRQIFSPHERRPKQGEAVLLHDVQERHGAVSGSAQTVNAMIRASRSMGDKMVLKKRFISDCKMMTCRR